MDRKRWLGWGAVALVVLGIVIAAVVSANQRPSGSGTGSDTGTPTATAGDSLSPTGGAAGASGTTPGAAGSSNGTSSLSAGAPTVSRPAAPGAKLVTITVPPAQTLAMISAKNASADSTYSVTFRPYGTGPARAGSPSIIIVVDSSRPGAGVEKPYDFTGRNVLVAAPPDVSKTVSKGGRYRGVIVLKLEGDLLIPLLRDASPES